jgi:hypothetical protein
MCGRSTEKYGVAVRAGTGDCGSRQRAATAALVLDYNRAKKRFDLLRPWARDSVEPAARGKGNPSRIGCVG